MKINKIFLFSHSNFIQDKMCKQVWMESRRLFLFQSDYKHMKIIGRTQLHYSTGISFDGGYSDYVITPTEALATIPDELSAVEAAPV
jgi:hypothetical protein